MNDIDKKFQEILPVLKRIKKAGGKAYIVGGFVRDRLLGIPSKDIDIEVYDLTMEDLENILINSGLTPKIVGKSFGVLKAGDYDFSLPRTDVKTGRGYKGFAIITDPTLSTKIASKRRDLTIGAILYDPLTNEYVDHFGGIDDLKEGIIKHVDDDSFAQDPLRILRVAQFTARFKFKIAPETEELCKKLVPELSALSYERVFIEIEKILMKADKPSIGFKFLHRIGALEVILPELEALSGIYQGTRYHAEGDALTHTFMVIDSIKKSDRDIALMLAALLHDTGKALVESEYVTDFFDDHVKFHGHAEELNGVHSILARLTTEKKIIEKVTTLVKYHMAAGDMFHAGVKKKLVRKLLAKGVDVVALMILHRADIDGRIGIKKDESYISEVVRVAKEISEEAKPLILGRHLIELGLKPGREFGVILKKAFDAQLEEKFYNLNTGLTYVKEYLI